MAPPEQLHKLWLCLHFPQLPLALACRKAPEQPTALLDKRGRVVCCNANAEACGIVSGMSRSVAQALCSELHLAVEAEQNCAEALADVLAWAYQFSPHVFIPAFNKPSHCVLLEVAACLRLFGGFSALLAKMSAAQAALICPYDLAVGYSPESAFALSHLSDTDWEKFVQSHLPPSVHDLQILLHGLPLTALPLSTSPLQSLLAMGLERIGKLLQLPKVSLGQKMGEEVLVLINALSTPAGSDGGQMSYQQPKEFHQRFDFSYETNNLAQIIPCIHRLLTQLCDFLQSMQCYTDRFV